MAKRKAAAQGGRKNPPLQRQIVNDSDEEGPNPKSTTSALTEHLHHSWTSAQTLNGLSLRTSTFTTDASPPKARYTYHDSRGHASNVSSNAVDSDEEDHSNGVDPKYNWQVEGRAVKESRKRKKNASDDPLRQWIPLRQEFLEEPIRLEGRGDSIHHDHCPSCENADRPAEFRCRDCFGGQLRCKMCLLAMHKAHPLHRIERWNGCHFEAVNLKLLGLRIQLGHEGGRCTMPHPAEEEFVVVDTHIIQPVSLDFCGCQSAQSHTTQLLRVRWFPATVVQPSTVATFRVLEHFHLGTLQSKQSAFDFYSAIERETDNTELCTPPDRYTSFLRMVREWRHLKALKRFGRGLLPDGVRTTKEGDLSMPCPACPQPGINLPEDWEDASEESRWLYNLILAVDANFRLRRKKISSDEADPPLGSGWAYFVEHLAYKAHLDHYGQQKDISTCSNLAAIGNANRRAKGLAVTGVGACVCARHQLLRKNGVADLQHGERYCNMDYLFFSTLRGSKIKQLVVSYDISCQWHKNLWQRMAALPSDFHLDLSQVLMRFVIPKFHLPAHISSCHSPFSFNFCSGVGRTDGEGIERDWSIINPVAYSTREMTPGHRADTLDDHWGDWNWRKVSGMGYSLARSIKAAVPERIKHVSAFRAMCDSLPATHIDEWRVIVKAWEAETAVKLPRDVEAENPYVLNTDDITQPAVRLQLAQADAARDAAGEIAMHEVSPALFMITGLELQEHQERIREDRKMLIGGTSTQRARLQERRNLLRRKIDAWITIQVVYMPTVTEARTRWERRVALMPKPPAHAYEPEERPLFLPSEIVIQPSASPLAHELHEIERKLREAQANDALRELRHYLRLLSFLWKDKNKHSRGQRENTRSQTLIKRSEAKKDSSVRRYRRAWKALVALAPDGPWSSTLRELRAGDVRGMTESEGDETEGRRTVSWIWTAAGVGTGSEAEDVGLHDSLRVEWCKARARALRWTEEIQLLREEMRRVQQWLTWRAAWWRDLARRRPDAGLELQEGIHSCASRQAQLHVDMREAFAVLWKETDSIGDSEIVQVEGPKKKD